MSAAALRSPAPQQRGMVLISSLLLLLILTMLAISMFKGFGLQERIAGNVREKQRALHAAEGAQQYAEWWLSVNNNAASQTVVCNQLLNANLNQGQICDQKLASVTTLPWQINSQDVGVTYNPGNQLTVTTTSAKNTYYAVPRFYIADAGASFDGTGEVYQIDAVGYGGTANAVAVVESTYVVKTGVTDRGLP